MRDRLQYLVLLTLFGCGSPTAPSPEAIKAVQPAAIPPEVIHPPKFDPRDINNTWEWLVADRRRLGELYWEAVSARSQNGLNTELMEKFNQTIGNYGQSLTKLLGRKVQWLARVDDISMQGVKIYCGVSDKIDPKGGSRASTYPVRAFVNTDQKHFDQYGHSDHDAESTLIIGKQVSLEFAKSLKKGESILVSGTIAGVFASKYGRDKEGPPDYVEFFLSDVSVSSTSAQ